jgi:hypothetical protein
MSQRQSARAEQSSYDHHADETGRQEPKCSSPDPRCDQTDKQHCKHVIKSENRVEEACLETTLDMTVTWMSEGK